MADKKDNNDPSKEELQKSDGDFVEPSDSQLPDPEQAANEWGTLEDIFEERVVDDDPFATNIHQNKDGA